MQCQNLSYALSFRLLVSAVRSAAAEVLPASLIYPNEAKRDAACALHHMLFLQIASRVIK